MDTTKIEKRRSFLVNIIFWMAVAAILYVLPIRKAFVCFKELRNK